ncbi:MAG: transposase [Candidatus Pacebacteria bacterium]|nr:transposase [Candidatus Paceibacterota bacterium]
MAKKVFRISPEIKEQIINRIKNDGVSVAVAAKDHGVSTVTIYSWLGTTAKGVSIIEHNKLKKENALLKALIGELTLKLSTEEKKGSR